MLLDNSSRPVNSGVGLPSYDWRMIMNKSLTDEAFAARPAQIDEPVVAININQQYPHAKNAEDLYNCTRGIWRLSRERAGQARYAFAVYQGVIKEVYEIEKWIPVSQATRDYWKERERAQGNDYSETHEGRSEFIGEVAPETVRKKYVGRRMPVRHSQNPIRYFNC
jgi:hypothetical protein